MESLGAVDRGRPPTNSVVFQNDLNMRRPQAQSTQHIARQAAPWNADASRTSDVTSDSTRNSPFEQPAAPYLAAADRTAPVSRTRRGAPGEGANQAMGSMLRHITPSPVDQQHQAAAPRPYATGPGPVTDAVQRGPREVPYAENEVPAADKEAFLAARAERAKQARAQRDRMGKAPVLGDMQMGESLGGLLLAKAGDGCCEARGPSAQPDMERPFAGEKDATKSRPTTKGRTTGGKKQRPPKHVARGAPACAASSKKGKSATTTTTTAKDRGPNRLEARKEASAKARKAAKDTAQREAHRVASAGSRKAARDRAERKAQKAGGHGAGADTETHDRAVVKKQRNSSRVLAPPGGKTSISFY